MKELSTQDPALSTGIANFATEQILANAMSAFAPHERLPRDIGNNPIGQIVLANEARFTASFASEPLTNYAVGWKDSANIEKTLDFLFPPVQVARRFEFKKADNSEAFYSETDDSRSIGADFKRVEYKGSTVLENTLNKGLTIRVDMDQHVTRPNWRELYTPRLLQRWLHNGLRHAITLAAGQATNPAKTWDIISVKDSDQVVLT